MPVHDDPLIHEAIASITAQTVHDLEVIVIDDGSSEPVELRSSDVRIRLARNDEATGPAAARNRGVALATGEFLAFLDSDDLYGPRRLEDALVGHSLGDCVVLRPQADDANSTSRIRTASLLESTTPHLGATSVRRTALAPFDETYLACEDIEWWIRAVGQWDSIVAVTSEQWVWRRGDHKRVLHGPDARLRNSYRLLEEYADFFAQQPRAEAYRWRRIAAMERKAGHRTNALRAVLAAARAHPQRALMKELLRIMSPYVK